MLEKYNLKVSKYKNGCSYYIYKITKIIKNEYDNKRNDNFLNLFNKIKNIRHV